MTDLNFHFVIAEEKKKVAMDLKNLLIDRPQHGARVGVKKTVEEIRQGLYKKTGSKSSTEGRTLRSIQVR